MKWQPFSHRSQPPPAVETHELTLRARNRILALLKELSQVQDHFRRNTADYHVRTAIEFAKRMAVLRDGELAVPAAHYEAYGSDVDIAIEHFAKTDTARAIDFLEYMFRSESANAYIPVQEINNILREEGIGIEFSPYVYKTYDTPQGPRNSVEIANFPEATKKTDEAIHRDVVMPALKVLGRNEFAAANGHMLKAHEHYRKGNNNRESITEALSALESAVKAICKAKNWQYRENKDTIDPLLKVLVDRQLMYDFYNSVLVGAATVRNRLGSHGKEPANAAEPYAEHVEHMLHMVSAHILFLARLAKMI
jgi:hypothetical protein